MEPLDSQRWEAKCGNSKSPKVVNVFTLCSTEYENTETPETDFSFGQWKFFCRLKQSYDYYPNSVSQYKRLKLVCLCLPSEPRTAGFYLFETNELHLDIRSQDSLLSSFFILPRSGRTKNAEAPPL